MIRLSFREFVTVSGAAAVVTVLSSYHNSGCASLGAEVTPACFEYQGWPLSFINYGKISPAGAIFDFIFYFFIFCLVLVLLRNILLRVRLY